MAANAASDCAWQEPEPPKKKGKKGKGKGKKGKKGKKGVPEEPVQKFRYVHAGGVEFTDLTESLDVRALPSLATSGAYIYGFPAGWLGVAGSAFAHSAGRGAPSFFLSKPPQPSVCPVCPVCVSVCVSVCALQVRVNRLRIAQADCPKPLMIGVNRDLVIKADDMLQQWETELTERCARADPPASFLLSLCARVLPCVATIFLCACVRACVPDRRFWTGCLLRCCMADTYRHTSHPDQD